MRDSRKQPLLIGCYLHIICFCLGGWTNPCRCVQNALWFTIQPWVWRLSALTWLIHKPPPDINSLFRVEAYLPPPVSFLGCQEKPRSSYLPAPILPIFLLVITCRWVWPWDHYLANVMETGSMCITFDHLVQGSYLPSISISSFPLFGKEKQPEHLSWTQIWKPCTEPGRNRPPALWCSPL